MDKSMDGKKRKENFSSQEIELLIREVEENKSLLFCKFDKFVDYKRKSAKWQEIARKINVCGNHRERTDGEVKKKWQDLKKQAKSRESERRAYMRGTGGGPPPKELSDLDLKIIEIIPDVVIDGIPGGGDTEELILTPSQTLVTVSEESLSEYAYVPQAGTSTESATGESEPPSCLPQSVTESKCKGLKRKKNDVDETIIGIEKEKLFLEKKKIDILVEIRSSLQELVELKRQKLLMMSANEMGCSVNPVIEL